MPICSPIDLTDCRGFFEKPATPSQRQYEALRAYFLEGLSSAEAAGRFGYTPAAFRMLCYEFRRGELPEFFALRRPGPREQPKKGKVRDQVVALRKRNYSIYDISRTLKQEGTPMEPLRCERSSWRRALPLCRGGWTKSASHRSGPPRRP